MERAKLKVSSGSSNDGTAGLAADDSFKATREGIERFAQIIFASQQKQREFWLGRGALSCEDLETRLGGMKPCMHGSDAHSCIAYPLFAMTCTLQNSLSPSSPNSMPIPEFL